MSLRAVLSVLALVSAALSTQAAAGPPARDQPQGDVDDSSDEEATCPWAAEGDTPEMTPGSDDEEVVKVTARTPDARALSSLEAAILAETNLLRRNPRAYADKLIALRPSYRGKLIHRPGQPSILTQEGVAALDEAIEALKRAPRSLSRLAHAAGLSRSAADHARDLGRTGDLGHRGSDGSGPDVRARRHGVWDGLVAENISFGPTDAEEIVIGLLVDDGVADRGHREVLLTRDLYFAGAACGPHPSYGTTCVMTYATTFRTRGQDEGEVATGEDDTRDEPEPAPVRRPVSDPWRLQPEDGEARDEGPADADRRSDPDDRTFEDREGRPFADRGADEDRDEDTRYDESLEDPWSAPRAAPSPYPYPRQAPPVYRPRPRPYPGHYYYGPYGYRGPRYYPPVYRGPYRVY